MWNKLKINKQRINKEKIIIIIGGWTILDIVYDILIKEIPEEYGCVACVLPFSIVSGDPKKMLKKVNQVFDKIDKQVKRLNKKKQREFFVVAQSMGTALAFKLAQENEIKKMVLTAPGNLVEAFWQGTRTFFIREKLKRQKYTYQDLKKDWKEYLPGKLLKGGTLRVKYLVNISKLDNVVPYENTKKMIDLMKGKGIKVKVNEFNLTTHNVSCLMDLIQPSSFLNFFKNK